MLQPTNSKSLQFMATRTACWLQLMQTSRLFALLLATSLFPATVSAQVFDPGPSDAALFTTIFNVPSDVLSGLIGNNGIPTQVNVSRGGNVENNVTASGVEVNIIGGIVGNGFFAARSSELNIIRGSVGEDFTASGSNVTIGTGGSIGNSPGFANSTLRVDGGEVGNSARIRQGSTVNVINGSISTDSEISLLESTINVSGGSTGHLNLGSQSVANISGGEVEELFLFGQSVANLSGGIVSGQGFAVQESEIQLTAVEAFLDGEAIDLQPSSPFFIEEGDTTPTGLLLTGILADGSAFSLNLFDEDFFTEDEIATGFDAFFLNSGARVSVVAPASVPEPSGGLLLALSSCLFIWRRTPVARSSAWTTVASHA